MWEARVSGGVSAALEGEEEGEGRDGEPPAAEKREERETGGGEKGEGEEKKLRHRHYHHHYHLDCARPCYQPRHLQRLQCLQWEKTGILC